MKLLKLIQYGTLGWLPFGRRYCVICRHNVWGFLPYRGGVVDVSPLMRSLDWIGSDVDNFECPRCGAHDRERHLYMYLEATGLLSRLSSMQIVHFAPEKRLSRLISAIGVSRYVGCDLYPSRPELERIDILNTGFESASFDLLIANHVLEHVDDDMQALSEIYRVLRPGGYAILQTPFSSKLQRTWQDDGIQGEMARLMAYGQEDHVRLYGKDIFERFSASGLSSMVRSHEELLPGVDPIKNGVNLFEPFMLFRRE